MEYQSFEDMPLDQLGRLIDNWIEFMSGMRDPVSISFCAARIKEANAVYVKRGGK